ncbi:MAG: tetratricopeptide repeat protein [Novosphingobium sp.]|nr:tetratricopeptide repeat protein [Novosphingobium sp.]
MTQHTTRPYPIARIALIVAALAAAFAVGFTISRSADEGGTSDLTVPDAVSTVASVSSLEEKTKANPENAPAWLELGQAYFVDSRFADAARAYDKATALVPDDAMAWSALGEARVMASERDPMPAEALAAFKRAIALDSKEPRARYFLAVKRDLDGDHEGAIADWLAVLMDTPENAPWRGDLIRTVEQVGKINGIDVAARLAKAGAQSPPAPPMPAAARAIPGPSAQDLAAASQIPPGEQREMAEGMVARLESRLKGDPANVDGWLMLIRSRATLGQKDKASQALKDAAAANPAQAAAIRQQAATLGVK